MAFRVSNPGNLLKRISPAVNRAVSAARKFGLRLTKSPKAAELKTAASDHWMKITAYVSATFGVYHWSHAAAYIFGGLLFMLLEHQVSE